MSYTLKDLKGYPLHKKLQFIWDYYKLPLAVAAICIIVSGSILHRHLTAKEPLLYLASVNVVTGDDLTKDLTEGFVHNMGADPAKTEVVYYPGLYLTEDVRNQNYQYSKASELKILGAIEARRLDVVLADRKAYEAFVEQGYLLDLADLFDGEVPEGIPAEEIVSDAPLLQAAGFTDDIYLGVLLNTPRKEAVKAFILYLYQK